MARLDTGFNNICCDGSGLSAWLATSKATWYLKYCIAVVLYCMLAEMTQYLIPKDIGTLFLRTCTSFAHRNDHYRSGFVLAGSAVGGLPQVKSGTFMYCSRVQPPEVGINYVSKAQAKLSKMPRNACDD